EQPAPLSTGPRASVHQLAELLEQVAAIVRPGGRFGMVLDAEHRQPAVAHALQGSIVQIHVRRLQLGREGLRAYREAMILGRDLHFVRTLVEHRLISAAVAELQLEGLAAQRQAEQLMAQTDSEDRLLADQAANGVDGVTERLRIAGAVGQENAVRFLS